MRIETLEEFRKLYDQFRPTVIIQKIENRPVSSKEIRVSIEGFLVDGETPRVDNESSEITQGNFKAQVFVIPKTLFTECQQKFNFDFIEN